MLILVYYSHVDTAVNTTTAVNARGTPVVHTKLVPGYVVLVGLWCVFFTSNDFFYTSNISPSTSSTTSYNASTINNVLLLYQKYILSTGRKNGLM